MSGAQGRSAPERTDALVSIDILSLGTFASASLFKNEFRPRISPYGLSVGKTPCLEFVGRDQDLEWSGAGISQVAECICGHRFPLLKRVLKYLRVGSSGFYTRPLVWRVPADCYRAALHCLLQAEAFKEWTLWHGREQLLSLKLNV